jgi:hypothetical protein
MHNFNLYCQQSSKSAVGITEAVAGEETFFTIKFLENVDLNTVDIDVIGPSPPRANVKRF